MNVAGPQLGPQAVPVTREGEQRMKAVLSEMTYFTSSGPSLQLMGTMTAPIFAAAPYRYTNLTEF